MHPKKIFWVIFLLCLCLVGAGAYFTLDGGKREQLVKRISDGFTKAATSEKKPSPEVTSKQSGNESSKLSLPDSNKPLPFPPITQEEPLNKFSNVDAQKGQPLGPLKDTIGLESNSTLPDNRGNFTFTMNSTAANNVDGSALEENGTISANATEKTTTTTELLPAQPSGANSHEASEQVIAFTIADQKRPGNALRGKILPINPSPEFTLVKQDSVIPYSFLQDLATFLADNYWPKGTHPSAVNLPYSSVTLGWINNRYGNFFNSGDQNSRPDAQRKKALSYAFNPLVMQALEKLYANRFIETLKESGFSHFSGEKESNTHVADMITYYSLKAKGVAASLKGFISAKEARQRSLAYIDAEVKLQEAFHQYDEARFSSQHGDSSVFRIAANNYQSAIRVRDQAKIRVASVMRRSTDTRRLTEDELSFIALWMTRRSQETYPGIIAFADALERLSKRMTIEADLLRK